MMARVLLFGSNVCRNPRSVLSSRHMRTSGPMASSMVLALTIGGAACTTITPQPQTELHFEPVTTAEFPNWRSSMATHGIDVADKAASIEDWQPGTELVYGLRTVIGGKTERWLLRFVEKTAPGRRQPITTPGIQFTQDGRAIALEARSADVEMTVSGPSGKTKTKSVHRVFCEPFQEGLYAGVTQQRKPRQAVTSTDRQLFAESFIGFFWLFMTISNEKTLRDILFSVADRPSIFSILLAFGLDMSFDLQSKNAEAITVTLGDRELPAYRLPASVTVNDRPVLHTLFTIATPRAPLQLGGGIITIEAYRPSNPAVHLVLSLLAGKR